MLQPPVGRDGPPFANEEFMFDDGDETFDLLMARDQICTLLKSHEDMAEEIAQCHAHMDAQNRMIHNLTDPEDIDT